MNKCLLMLSYIALMLVWAYIPAFAQKEELEKYLTACESLDEQASKKTVKEYSFHSTDPILIIDYGNIKGELVDTDISGVQAFKGTVVCKVEEEVKVMNVKKVSVDKKMAFIMYYDKLRKVWSVFGLRPGVEPDHEYTVSKAKVDKGDFYSSKEVVYRNLTYWSLMNGMVGAAKKYGDLANENAAANKNDSFLLGFEKDLQAIL